MKFKAQLMTTEAIARALKRIAHQIAEKNNGVENVILLGIKNGGIPIAKQLADNLRLIEGRDIPYADLDVTYHRDDISGETKPAENVTAPFDVTGKDVVLVDDVLYTGRTVRAALDAVSRLGRAATIQLAVLIDRGHRELPIRADFVGKNIPTSHSEKICIDFDETGTRPEVNIYDL